MGKVCHITSIVDSEQHDNNENIYNNDFFIRT